jgi:hypothetical protein
MADLIKATTPTLRVVVIGACFMGLVLGAILLGSKKEGEAMAVAKPSPVPNVTIPPVDTSVPARTETATFALG